MRSIVILVLLIIFNISQPAIADRFSGNSDALDHKQLQESCYVCQKFFLKQTNLFQAYRIRAACLALAKNECCENFRLVNMSVLNIREEMKNLRHLNHGIDLI